MPYVEMENFFNRFWVIRKCYIIRSQVKSENAFFK